MWASRGKLKQNLARLKIALYIAGEQFRSRRKKLFLQSKLKALASRLNLAHKL